MNLPHTVLKRIGDAAMNALINAIELGINRLEAQPLANMKFVTVTFAAAFTNQRVFHGLGYPLTGFWIVDQGILSTVARSAVVDSDPNNFVVLGTNVAGIVTLAVF